MMEQTITYSSPIASKRSLKFWKSILKNLALITVGSIIFVIGMNSILIPQHFLTGGITGIAIVLHYWIPSLNVGLMYLLLNIPLALLGWFQVSRRFVLFTIFGIVFFSLAANVIRPPVAAIHDPFLAAIFGGVVCGVGGGLILRSIGSAGGIDILAIYINNTFGFRPGLVIFFVNLLPLAMGLYLFNLEVVLYSVVYMFTYTKVIDAVLTEFNQRKFLLVISDQARAIGEHIMSEEHRGVTYLKAEGGYTGEDRKVIFSITTLTELPKIKEFIFSTDPNAFVVINDTLEVLGKHHGKLKVY
jgi:uncharacterized membrane-anchored protein YitT (DUF2179 family)